MATQRWTIAKIGGAAALPIREKFKCWQEQSQLVAESDDCIWDPTTLTTIREFVGVIRARSIELPIVFFSEHVDMWSVGAFEFDYLKKVPDAIFVDAEYAMACLGVTVNNDLAALTLDRMKRKSLSQENAWFLTNFLHAVHAWEELIPNAVILLIREPIGGSVLDNEVIEACSIVPEWLDPT